jgi:hypothetical protein
MRLLGGDFMRPLAAVLGGLIAGAITSFVLSRVRLWGDE